MNTRNGFHKQSMLQLLILQPLKKVTRKNKLIEKEVIYRLITRVLCYIPLHLPVEQTIVLF
jgi:hypothetical protein